MNKDLEDYRNFLVQAKQKSIDSYDKSLLTLSGGALAISLIFIENVIGASKMDVPLVLIFAWICWVNTITWTLLSFYLSHIAMKKTIKQVDDGVIYNETPGGCYTCIISILNAVDGLFFIVGVILVMVFAIVNLNMG